MQYRPRGISERYVVLDYLAEGGMGAVYLGRKLGAGGFQKQVVLKQLLPEFVEEPEFIDLFLREARLSATLDHANIIHTIDFVTASDELFIVMEYLDGADLANLLAHAKASGNRISVAASLYIARELLSALTYAHAKHDVSGKHLRIIHRDISPSNILISATGEVKLTDFGIAKAATHNSILYRVKGKAAYMSPEQAHSKVLDARSDIYSLAVCLYEALVGERLLVSAGLATSVDELYSKPVPNLAERVPGLPMELDAVMRKALAVDRDERFQTASEFQEALLRQAHRHGLLMSAPELATHLNEVCGDPAKWREPPVHRAGPTEVYSHEEEEHEASMRNAQKAHRVKTSMSLLADLQGVELTSTGRLVGSTEEGAAPLIDMRTLDTITPLKLDHSTLDRQVSEEQTQVVPVSKRTQIWIGIACVVALGVLVLAIFVLR